MSEVLPRLPYRLVPALSHLGAEASVVGTLPLEHFSKGSMELTLDEGVDYDLALINTGSGVVLSGLARCRAHTACSRCLEDALVDIEGEVEGYFILRPRDEELAMADDEFVIVGKNGMVDLAPAILAALTYELPFVVLCREDCAGLCPECGVNRNVQTCHCGEAVSDDHPFAALRVLLQPGTSEELEGLGSGDLEGLDAHHDGEMSETRDRP